VKVPAQTGAGVVEEGVTLAKAEPRKVLRSAVLVESRDRNGGNAGFGRDVTAEL
jgi:hypothetical protein